MCELPPIDLDKLPRVYATGNLVIHTDIGWVHIIRGEPEPEPVLHAEVPPLPPRFPQYREPPTAGMLNQLIAAVNAIITHLEYKEST